MKRALTVVMVCLVIVASVPMVQASADPNVRCTKRRYSDGVCTFEVGGSGSGGQPGKPGRIPARPREHTGTGDTGGDSEEKPPGYIEGCIRYDMRTGKCLIFKPSESPEPNPAGAPEPVVLARVAVGRMDLRAPEIG